MGRSNHYAFIYGFTFSLSLPLILHLVVVVCLLCCRCHTIKHIIRIQLVILCFDRNPFAGRRNRVGLKSGTGACVSILHAGWLAVAFRGAQLRCLAALSALVDGRSAALNASRLRFGLWWVSAFTPSPCFVSFGWSFRCGEDANRRGKGFAYSRIQLLLVRFSYSASTWGLEQDFCQ